MNKTDRQFTLFALLLCFALALFGCDKSDYHSEEIIKAYRVKDSLRFENKLLELEIKYLKNEIRKDSAIIHNATDEQLDSITRSFMRELDRLH